MLREYGDERFADRIAAAIVATRPIETTAELAAIVRDAIPAPARRRGGHPAKRTFQAIRIEVNRELEILPDAIDDAIDHRPGGRVAVLSYHSGEDRIVKDRFRHARHRRLHLPARPAVRVRRRPDRAPAAAARGSRAQAEVRPTPGPSRPALRAVEKLAVGSERRRWRRRSTPGGPVTARDAPVSATAPGTRRVPPQPDRASTRARTRRPTARRTSRRKPAPEPRVVR